MTILSLNISLGIAHQVPRTSRQGFAFVQSHLITKQWFIEVGVVISKTQTIRRAFWNNTRCSQPFSVDKSTATARAFDKLIYLMLLTIISLTGANKNLFFLLNVEEDQQNRDIFVELVIEMFLIWLDVLGRAKMKVFQLFERHNSGKDHMSTSVSLSCIDGHP